MKRTVIIAAAAALMCQALAAQNADAVKKEGWLRKYERQIKAVGPSGPGVETILDGWGEADSTSAEYLKARYVFWYDKSHRVEVEANDNPKYLGMEPLFNLRDTLNKKTLWYYQVDEFDDELLGKSLRYLDKAIASSPADLELRTYRISSLMLYEKEDPTMTLSAIMELIDENYAQRPKWLWQGSAVDDEFFKGLIQEFCYNLFNIGSVPAREAFLKVSRKMLSYGKTSTEFMANVGSYLMSVKDYKKALKQFDKVLKLDADNETAIRNCVTIARILKDEKLKKKYNPMLARLQ